MKFQCIFLILGYLFQFVYLTTANRDDTICSGKENGFMYPNDDDCSTFFVCQYEIPTLIQCDKGLHFDPILNVCNWPSEVVCGERPIVTTSEPELTTTSIVTEIPSTTETDPSIENNKTCSVDEPYFSHPDDKSKYYICVSSYPVLMNCPINNFWNNDRQICVMFSNYKLDCNGKQTFFSYLNDFTKYIICVGEQSIEMKCPVNTYWNEVSVTCKQQTKGFKCH